MLWSYLKTIGKAVVLIGFLIMVFSGIAWVFIPQYAISAAYFVSVGVYFIVAGIVVYLLGAAAEAKAEQNAKKALPKGP